MSHHDELMQLERGFWESAGKPDFYREHFADDGLMVFHVGILDKPQVVEAMEHAEPWASYTIDDPRFVDVGKGVTSLTYATVAPPRGSSEDYRAYLSSVYARRHGRWLLVLHQQTPRE